jgi:hypothetical protein
VRKILRDFSHEDGRGNFIRWLCPHIQDLGRVVSEIGATLMEEAFHGARETGGDLESAIRGELLQKWIAARGHLAEIRNGVE